MESEIDLGALPVTVACPECQAEIPVEVNQVIAEERVVCPQCTAEVQLRDKRSAVYHATAAAEAALEKLEAAVEQTGTEV